MMPCRHIRIWARHRVAQPFFQRRLRGYFTRHLLDEAPPVPLPLTPVPPDAGTWTP